MNQPKYRVFVCTRKRENLNHPENCCFNCGGEKIYRAFHEEIEQQQLANRVEIRQSGCLDRCEAGTVVMVYRAHWKDFAWLPNKIQRKLRKLLFPNRHLYGHLTCEDIPAIVESHFIDGKPLKQKLLTNAK
jgi:(2Fe-2S) ferredoxin